MQHSDIRLYSHATRNLWTTGGSLPAYMHMLQGKFRTEPRRLYHKQPILLKVSNLFGNFNGPLLIQLDRSKSSMKMVCFDRKSFFFDKS